MPMYNAESYIDECMESIIGQSHKKWELIVVDDFSTDGSVEKVKQYTALDTRVKLYSNTEKGIISALKIGYSKSHGKFITRMDSDDIMSKHKLSSLRGVLQNEHEVAVGKVSYFSSEKTMENGYTTYADWLNTLIDTNSHFQNIYKECVIPSPCWMMGRSTFENIGRFDGFGYPEDYDLAFRMYVAGIKVKPVFDILHYWRDHDLRASRNDPNYSDQSFLPLKMHYFLNHDYDPTKNIYLWGGGRAGKALAKALISVELQFQWYTDNPNKIGHDIYGVKLRDFKCLDKIFDGIVITAIRTPTFISEHSSWLAKLTEQGNRIVHFH